MGIIKQEAYFVVTDYNFESVENFENVFLNSSSCQNYISDFKKNKLNKIKINGILLEDSISKPIAVYKNSADDEIRFNLLTRRLDLISRNYDKNKAAFYSELLKALFSFKLQEISNIGMNFIVQYDTGDKKLNIFNSEIHEKIKDFPKNVGFQVTLPLDLGEDFNHKCIGTYDVTKIEGGEGKNYVYAIASNFNFELVADKADPLKRLEELQLITEQVSKIYLKFEKTYNEIIKL